jgi:DNA polymerase-3 subunit chi
MTSIDFYFNAGDRYAVACRLAAKALQQKKRLMVYAPEPQAAQQIDRMLWTQQALSFLPHCRTDDPLAADTPLLICAGEAPPEDHPCEILLNLSAATPPRFERHERLLEIVSRDEDDRAAARERHKFYKSRGYEIRNHDLAAAPAHD